MVKISAKAPLPLRAKPAGVRRRIVEISSPQETGAYRPSIDYDGRMPDCGPTVIHPQRSPRRFKAFCFFFFFFVRRAKDMGFGLAKRSAKKEEQQKKLNKIRQKKGLTAKVSVCNHGELL